MLWAGRHRRDVWEDLCARYKKRIARFAKLTDLPVRTPGSSSQPGRSEAEGRALLRATPDGAWTVAVDRRGRARSSEELAEWLEERFAAWPGPLAFLLGSDLGLSHELRQGVSDSLSFGPMTLPHELARLVLYEQLYRGFCISAGIKYHRGSL